MRARTRKSHKISLKSVIKNNHGWTGSCAERLALVIRVVLLRAQTRYLISMLTLHPSAEDQKTFKNTSISLEVRIKLSHIDKNKYILKMKTRLRTSVIMKRNKKATTMMRKRMDKSQAIAQIAS